MLHRSESYDLSTRRLMEESRYDVQEQKQHEGGHHITFSELSAETSSQGYSLAVLILVIMQSALLIATSLSSWRFVSRLNRSVALRTLPAQNSRPTPHASK